jgi:iron(III) transport system permease protein
MTLPDATSWQLFTQTVALVLATLAVCLPLGTLLAALLWRTDLAWRRAWLAVLAVQLFVPMYVHAAAWDSGFGVTGWFTALTGANVVWLEGFRGAVWVHAVSSLPWIVLIIGCGLRLVEPELEEEALLHTAPASVLVRVTLRRALPAIGVAALWVALTTAGEMTATDLFRVRTFAEEIYTGLSGGKGSGEAVVGILPLVIVVAALVVAGVSLLARMTPRELPASTRSRASLPLDQARRPLSAVTAAVMCALTAAPLASLIYKAGIDVVKVDGQATRFWSVGKLLERVFGAGWWQGEGAQYSEPGVLARFGDEMAWSLQLGAAAATSATVVGLALAWWLRQRGRRGMALWSLLAASLAVPGPLVALALIFLLNRSELPWLAALYDQTLLAPWLALLVRTLPWTTLILWFAVRSVPSDVLDAAAIDGAGPLAQLTRIVLPLRYAAIGLAWLVAFVLSLGDLAFTVIVLPPGVETISVRIFRLMHAAADSEVAAVCLVILFGLSAATGALALLNRVRREGVTR